MDFSILYRIFWKPREVFKEVDNKRRLEPFIFIGAMAFLFTLNAYRGSFEALKKHPSLLVIALFQIAFGDLMIPIVNATIIYFATRFLFERKLGYWALVSVFILCGMPFYVEGVMHVFGYRSLGFGSLVPFLKSTHPFMFGMVATLTLFFVWMIYLWWVAMKQLLSLQRRQNTLLVGSLVLVNMIVGGMIWRLVSMFIIRMTQ